MNGLNASQTLKSQRALGGELHRVDLLVTKQRQRALSKHQAEDRVLLAYRTHSCSQFWVHAATGPCVVRKQALTLGSQTSSLLYIAAPMCE